jgi:hypothetical protein
MGESSVLGNRIAMAIDEVRPQVVVKLVAAVLDIDEVKAVLTVAHAEANVIAVGGQDVPISRHAHWGGREVDDKTNWASAKGWLVDFVSVSVGLKHTMVGDNIVTAFDKNTECIGAGAASCAMIDVAESLILSEQLSLAMREFEPIVLIPEADVFVVPNGTMIHASEINGSIFDVAMSRVLKIITMAPPTTLDMVERTMQFIDRVMDSLSAGDTDQLRVRLALIASGKPIDK